MLSNPINLLFVVVLLLTVLIVWRIEQNYKNQRRKLFFEELLEELNGSEPIYHKVLFPDFSELSFCSRLDIDEILNEIRLFAEKMSCVYVHRSCNEFQAIFILQEANKKFKFTLDKTALSNGENHYILF